MWTPQYVTYYGVHLDHHSETWGSSTFNKILVTEYPDSNVKATGVTETNPGGVTSNIDFLYPQLVQSKYYLDGMAEGHITVKATVASKTIDSFTVAICKLSNSGTVTTLGSMSYTFSTPYGAGVVDTYSTFPVFINLSKAVVNENEKLFLRCVINVTGDVIGVSLSHYNDANIPDIKIKIPYAPTG